MAHLTSLPAPKALLFDWDNTLVDTWPVIHAALAATLEELGHRPWTLDEVKRKVARSMRDSFPAIFGEAWQEAGARYQQNFRAIHLERLSALPGSEALLLWLARQPVYKAVVSNKRGDTLRREAAHIGWDRYFGSIIGAEDTKRDKPAIDPVLAALAGSSVTPGPEVWFIGDSPVDMECAAAAGCTPIWFGPPPETPLAHQAAWEYEAHPALQARLSGFFPA